MNPQPPSSPSLSLRDALVALATVAVWGTNFVIIKQALFTMPPLFFAALRFAFVLFPAVFFLKRPASWTNLAGYGILIGAGQFGILYLAMQSDITPGLTSLVLQSQVIFTIGLSIVLRGERAQPFQWVAVALAVAGLGVIAANAGGTTTPLGLAMVLVAALFWAGGNLVSKQAGHVNMLAYVVWASLFSVPPLLVLSLIFEGPSRIADSMQHAGFFTWIAILWQSVGNAMFGFGAWGWLLSRYPAATVAPTALLVPVFGMASASLFMAEPLQGWKLGAAALVLAGLALNTLWPVFEGRRHRT